MISLKRFTYNLPENSIDTIWENIDNDTFGTYLNPEFSFLTPFLYGTPKSFVGRKSGNTFKIYRYKQQFAQFRPDIVIRGYFDEEQNKLICSYGINKSGQIFVLFFSLFVFMWIYFNSFNVLVSVLVLCLSLVLYTLFAILELRTTIHTFETKIGTYLVGDFVCEDLKTIN